MRLEHAREQNPLCVSAFTGLSGRYTSHHKQTCLVSRSGGTLLFSSPQTQSDLSTSFLQGIRQVYKQENMEKTGIATIHVATNEDWTVLPIE